MCTWHPWGDLGDDEVGPHRIEELLLGDHLAGARGQGRQQIHHLGAQPHDALFAAQLACHTIDPSLAETKPIRPGTGSLPS